MYGAGCFAATVTAFLRDTAQLIGIFLTVVFWATPIVYPISMIPARQAWLRAVLRANPVAHLVEWYRGAFSLHVAPSAASVLYLVVFSGLVALSGAALFAKARPHFADLM
jgi:ABC-type polysaccharide/polyol phosphate export permease